MDCIVEIRGILCCLMLVIHFVFGAVLVLVQILIMAAGLGPRVTLDLLFVGDCIDII